VGWRKQMKVLIVSDTHGVHGYLDKALKQVGEIDMFIHLGDVSNGFEYIDAVIDCEKYIIGGNNDFLSDLPRELEFHIGSKKVFITHGHRYLHSWSTKGAERIINFGRSKKADIIMFGHIHMPVLEILPDITVLNPGSISYPRQAGRRSTFVLMEIDSNDNIKYSTYFLKKNGKFVCL
jgi:putative phosphoesterase